MTEETYTPMTEEEIATSVTETVERRGKVMNYMLEAKKKQLKEMQGRMKEYERVETARREKSRAKGKAQKIARRKNRRK